MKDVESEMTQKRAPKDKGEPAPHHETKEHTKKTEERTKQDGRTRQEAHSKKAHAANQEKAKPTTQCTTCSTYGFTIFRSTMAIYLSYLAILLAVVAYDYVYHLYRLPVQFDVLLRKHQDLIFRYVKPSFGVMRYVSSVAAAVTVPRMALFGWLCKTLGNFIPFPRVKAVMTSALDMTMNFIWGVELGHMLCVDNRVGFPLFIVLGIMAARVLLARAPAFQKFREAFYLFVPFAMVLYTKAEFILGPKIVTVALLDYLSAQGVDAQPYEALFNKFSFPISKAQVVEKGAVNLALLDIGLKGYYMYIEKPLLADYGFDEFKGIFYQLMGHYTSHHVPICLGLILIFSLVTATLVILRQRTMQRVDMTEYINTVFTVTFLSRIFSFFLSVLKQFQGLSADRFVCLKASDVKENLLYALLNILEFGKRTRTSDNKTLIPLDSNFAYAPYLPVFGLPSGMERSMRLQGMRQ